MNQIGREPLKLNNEWWKGEVWSPINLLCIEQQGTNTCANVNAETINIFYRGGGGGGIKLVGYTTSKTRKL